METLTVKVFDLHEIAEEFGKLVGMLWSTGGTWNAPKDIKSFEISLISCSDDSYVTEGDHKWQFYGPLDPPWNFQLKMEASPDNPNHFFVDFHVVIDYLIINKILQENEYVLITYDW